MQNIPIWEKSNLTLEEAAAYSGIGINKLRKLSDSESCPCRRAGAGSIENSLRHGLRRATFPQREL